MEMPHGPYAQLAAARTSALGQLAQQLPPRYWPASPVLPHQRPSAGTPQSPPATQETFQLVGLRRTTSGLYCFRVTVFFALRPIKNHANDPITGSASTINAQTTWLPVV